MVGLSPDGTALRFSLGNPGGLTAMMIPPQLRALALEPGTVIELAAAGQAIAEELGRRLKTERGAALIIDYGHAAQVPTETLQAVRRHKPVPVLDCPGDADLTCHVDFSALAFYAHRGGAITHGPVGQGELLRALGIEARAAVLRRAATPEQSQDIAAALNRLTQPEQMGSLFKAMAITGADDWVPAGF